MLIAIFYLLGLLAGAIAGSGGEGGFSSLMLQWFFLVGIGAPLVVSGIGHVFRGELAAQRLGWEPGSPFQKELGIWDLAVGTMAIVAFWHHGGFWLAATLVNVIFWTGAGTLHLAELLRRHNVHVDNLLPAVVDFLVPATLLVFYLAS